MTYHLNEAAPIIVPKAYLSLYLSQYALMTASCHSVQLIYACTLPHYYYILIVQICPQDVTSGGTQHFLQFWILGEELNAERLDLARQELLSSSLPSLSVYLLFGCPALPSWGLGSAACA